MPPDNPPDQKLNEPGLALMRRFLPYLWPKGQPGLKARVIGAFA